ncbi:AraC-like DNA-binding protein [Chitinophaga skermanii]|uniref:AraC-like DNA-binding protein n=1 Tax=Chitinophaga skermanii TaxID=331697 RepID=A0A327QW42_9BACT|nr:AraC family transcriptional regulator [Chitinophaga skermanii]RAJ08571.1 AraC-like DNA-binding protein [Chitinophaga skermanii]
MNPHQQQFLLHFLAYAAQRNVDITTLCQAAQLNIKQLRKKQAPALTPHQWHRLWQAAIDATGDELFGLHFGESMQLVALGTVGEIIKSSDTIGDAVQTAASLAYLVTDLFSITIERKKHQFSFQFIPKGNTNSLAFRQMMDLFLVFTVHELDGFVLQKLSPLQVRIGYTIAQPSEYERVLRCAPIYKKDVFSLTFPSTYWEEPIITANHAAQQQLLANIHALQQNGDSMQAKIHNYLVTNAYLGIASLEDIAANLGMSPRTLQRKLKEEGLKYQQLTDEVRKVLALQYLAGNSALKEIAGILGYNEISAFNRAFKRWTGNTPSEMRLQLQAN